MHYQAFKVGLDGPIIELMALFLEQVGHHVIPWEDIVFRFPNVHCVQFGNRVAPFIRKPGSLEYISPKCIEYLPDTILDVVMVVTSPLAANVKHSLPLSPVSPPPSLTDHRSERSSPMNDIAESAGSEEVSILTESKATAPDNAVCIGAAFASNSEQWSVDIATSNIPTSTHCKDNSVMGTIDPVGNYATLATETSTGTTTTANMETVATQINQASSPNSFVESRRFMERLQSVARSFEQLLIKGQNDQAIVVKQESESIKQEMSLCFESLHNEVAKNVTLQKQILELQKAAIDTDQLMLNLQNKALEKLALIQSKVAAILTQTYELHEYPIPRLFIILPKEDISKAERIGMGIAAPFVHRFRLYFLCECGEHTRPANGTHSNIPHEIHLARHEGYDLDRPTEFFKKYGTYVLALLQMLRYGVMAAGLVVAPLASVVKSDEMEAAGKVLENLSKDLVPKVDFSIKYLKSLTEGQGSVGPVAPEGSSTTAETNPMDRMDQLEALEGADLRHLVSYLKTKDETRVLGNLYRMATVEGHIKWVCLDHYRENYGTATTKEFRELVTTFGGEFDENKGSVNISLRSPDDADRLYCMLLAARFVLQVDIILDWNTTYEHLKTFKETIQKSNIRHLRVDLLFNNGPTTDILNRGRRSEPLLQLMAGGRVRSLTVLGVTEFFSRVRQWPSRFLIRVLNISQALTSVDILRLKDILLVSPALVQLSAQVPSLRKGFESIQVAIQHHNNPIKVILTEPDPPYSWKKAPSVSLTYGASTGQATSMDLRVDSLGHDFLPLAALTDLTVSSSLIKTSTADLVQSLLKSCPCLRSLDVVIDPRNIPVCIFLIGSIPSVRTLSIREWDDKPPYRSFSFPLKALDLASDFYTFAEVTEVEPLFGLYPSLLGLSLHASNIDEAYGTIQSILASHPRNMELKIKGGNQLLSARFSPEGEVPPLIEAHILRLSHVKHIPLNAVSKLTIHQQEQDDSMAFIDRLVQECVVLEVLEITYRQAFPLSVFAVGAISSLRTLRLTNHMHLDSIEYSFPLSRLDLSSQAVINEGLILVDPMLKANPKLRELSFLVTDVVEVLKEDPIALLTAGTLSRLNLEDSSKSKASFSFDKYNGVPELCTLQLTSTFQCHRAVLALASDSRQYLEIDTLSVEDLPQIPYRIPLHIKTIDIRCGANYLPFFLKLSTFVVIQQCTLRETGNTIAFDLDSASGILTIGSPFQLGSQLPDLKVILCAYPSLTAINIIVDSIAEGFHTFTSFIGDFPLLSKLELKQKGVGPKVAIFFRQDIKAGFIMSMELVIRSLKQLPLLFYPFLTKLTISGEARNWKNDELEQIPLAACRNLTFLGIKCPVQQFIRIFQHFHKEALTHTALMQLKLWDGTSDGILIGNNINNIDTVELRFPKVTTRNSQQIIEVFAAMPQEIQLEINTFEIDQKATLPLIRQIALRTEQGNLLLKHLDIDLSGMTDLAIFEEIAGLLEGCNTDLAPTVALLLRDDSIFKHAKRAGHDTPLLKVSSGDKQGHAEPSALGKIMVEFVTRLVVADAGLDLFEPEVQLAALGPPRQLLELDCRRTGDCMNNIDK
ncbi:hypothetical protein EC991_003066 [Linnemannia zychae]|nr:hypothetical protein EC991_003066 [Linnemannia zychae]